MSLSSLTQRARVTPPARKPAREAGPCPPPAASRRRFLPAPDTPEERVTPYLRVAAPTPGDVIASTGIQAPWSAGFLGAANGDAGEAACVSPCQAWIQ